MIDSVKIIHTPTQIKSYRFWADYFRFVGVHVWDCTLKNNDFSTDFSIVIVLENGISEDRLQDIRERYRNLVLFENSDEHKFFNVDAKEKSEVDKWTDYWNRYLNDGLQAIQEKFLQLQEQSTQNQQFQADLESIKAIGKIYVKYCISYYRNVYSYFKEDERLVQNAQDKFVDAYVELSKDPGYEKNAYTLYALASLTRYINETCVFLNQELLLPTKQCIAYLDQAIKQRPEFNNAELLKAIVCGIDKTFYFECGEYYKIALDNMGDKKYTSYPQYLYGRYWERVAKNIVEAKKYYQKSFEINQLEYRAIYKLAVIAKQEGNYEESLKWFEKIRHILSEKEKANYLQPKEYEYLFKAYFEACKLYGDVFFDLGKYEENMRNLDELCDKMSNEEKENSAYKEIFGEQEQMFRKKTFLRIKMIQMQCKD